MASVVIPLYNRRDYIRRAIDSVLDQTYRDFELIVVDDGSTDGSGNIVREYQDPRVRLVTQTNGGECAARNRGVAESRTKWIGCLDSDDEWLPTFLERTMKVATENPFVAAVFTLYRTETQVKRVRPGVEAGVLADYMRFIVDNEVAMFSSAVLLRKDVLEAAGGFPVGVRWGGDVDTWARIAWTGKIGVVPEVLAIWHCAAEGRVTNEGAVKRQFALVPVIKSYESWKEQGRIPEDCRESTERYLQQVYLSHSRLLAEAGNRPEARRVLHDKCRASLCGWRRYLKTYLYVSLPRRLILGYRVIAGFARQFQAKIRRR
ncbi:MAG: glycosyltransferase family A protein [Thermoguttaceae bacterium]